MLLFSTTTSSNLTWFEKRPDARRVCPQTDCEDQGPATQRSPCPAIQQSPVGQVHHESTTTTPPAIDGLRMDRTLKTVAEVWQECDEGRDGQPSVRLMQRHHGVAWRSGPADRKFFSNRNSVYKATRRLSPNDCHHYGKYREVGDRDLKRGRGEPGSSK
ncbi:transcriptional activator of glycolytic enzymes-domain-containing protein [Phlyctochytrium arcticum]|nr:transcriptional activator of glycolytic enzymes-domain-containing protein [Phlyctochytrium arcticum]